jgi:hypothetical protein
VCEWDRCHLKRLLLMTNTIVFSDYTENRLPRLITPVRWLTRSADVLPRIYRTLVFAGMFSSPQTAPWPRPVAPPRCPSHSWSRPLSRGIVGAASLDSAPGKTCCPRFGLRRFSVDWLRRRIFPGLHLLAPCSLRSKVGEGLAGRFGALAAVPVHQAPPPGDVGPRTVQSPPRAPPRLALGAPRSAPQLSDGTAAAQRAGHRGSSFPGQSHLKEGTSRQGDPCASSAWRSQHLQ